MRGLCQECVWKRWLIALWIGVGLVGIVSVLAGAEEVSIVSGACSYLLPSTYFE